MARKTRAKKVEQSAVSVALELLDVRQQINELKRVDKILSEELRTRIHSGEKQGTYTLRKDFQLAIADQEKAYKWAESNSCLKIDVSSVDKLLKQSRSAVPEGFGIREVEKLVERVENEIAQEEFIITG